MRSFLLFPFFFFAETVLALSVEEVVRSSFRHHPSVNQALMQMAEAESTLQSSEGSFDAKAKLEIDSRTTGYYDGDTYKAVVEKPLPFLNSKLYGGKRQTFGSLPVYEGKNETLNGGEFFAGFNVSLLRDSLIDSTRYQIRMQKQESLQAKLKYEQMLINLQEMAIKSYWVWLIKGQELKVYQNLLGLAQTRAQQIAKRIKVGDLAAIYEAENNQYLRKRESQVVYAQIEFQKASFYLSLFYRDGAGQPLTPSLQDIPPLSTLQKDTSADWLALHQKALQANLAYKILQSQKEQAQLDKRLGRNEILPQVNVGFEWNQDQGFGPNRLMQDENRVMVNIEVPIEYNKGIGKLEAGKAKLSQIESKAQLVKEKIRVETETLKTNLDSYVELNRISDEQVQFAKTLAKAEVRKFNQGASDLILVNLREESMAEAEINFLTTRLQYQFFDADLKTLTVDFLVPI